MTTYHNLRMLVLLLGLSVVVSAHAEGEGTTLFKSIPQPDEILNALGESSNATGETHKVNQRSLTKPGSSTRAIKVISNTTPPPTPATTAAAPAPQTAQSASAQNNKSKVAFPLTFDINSATLTSEAERYLDSLAKALQEKPNLNLQISGHTDTSGGDAINQPLSLQRAEAVKHYLSVRHHIDPTRLTTSGAGSRQLLFKDNPRAQENRRVEFVKNN
ncbi:MAG: OmpA family protein [Magnetococcus sp. YQC-5]